MRCTLKDKNGVTFDIKSWVTSGTKIRPGIPSNWKIFQSNWLDIESQSHMDSQYHKSIRLESVLNWLSISSQFDWNIFQLLGIPGQILVPLVTQLCRSKWLHFFQCTVLLSPPSRYLLLTKAVHNNWVWAIFRPQVLRRTHSYLNK